tara:strand:+ start:30 stop:476 length:447 start_codon:yes stop_codon:yes gene_type:complete
MAYITQEMKRELAPGINKVLKKYGCKGSISTPQRNSLCVTISQGPIDFIGKANKEGQEYSEWTGRTFYPIEGSYQENPYRYSDPVGGPAADDYSDKFHIADLFLDELRDAMRGTLYYNNDDIMTDYFDSAYFMSINIGKWDKPYKLEV